ncbi:hypothetical protein MY1884_008831 [Beauveria asiatica]
MSVDDTMPTRSQDQQGRPFHGPSSVMFDSDNNRRTSLKHNSHQTPLDERTRAQLVANHTKQRHLEIINANSGKLDLDGVDVDLAMDLLAIFWNRQYYEGSAVYRPVFMRDMAANGPSFPNCCYTPSSSLRPILDKIHAIYQGRPARLSGANVSVPIMFHDDYDEFEPFQTITFTATPRQLRLPTHSLSTMVELCKLSQIMDKVLRELYAEQSQTMVSMYDSLIILLHRPFVSEGHLQSASSFIAREALSHCVTAAFEVDDMLQLYRQHFCVKTVPYFMSYATYVSATIHARLASLKLMGTSPAKCLRNCLNVLTEQQTKCHAPRRTLRILKQLIRRLGLRVEDLPTEESDVSHGNEPDSDGHILTPAMSSLPGGAHLSRASEQPPASIVAEDRMHDGNMTKFDSMFLDMDMDGILKSFRVVSNDAVPVQKPL